MSRRVAALATMASSALASALLASSCGAFTTTEDEPAATPADAEPDTPATPPADADIPPPPDVGTDAPLVLGSALLLSEKTGAAITGQHATAPARTYFSAAGFSLELWFRASVIPTGDINDFAHTMLAIGDVAGCEDTYLGFGADVAPQNVLAFVSDSADNGDGGGCASRDNDPARHVPKDGWMANRWYHIVAVRNPTSALLYVDGAKVDERERTGAIVVRPMQLQIGRWADGQSEGKAYFLGAIDEVHVYSRPLTATDVADRYAGGLGKSGSGNEVGLTAGYHFDEGMDASTPSFLLGAPAATLHGDATWGPGKVPLP